MEYDIIDLGLVDFEESYRVQKETFTKVKTGLLESALIICRHHPVITAGRACRGKKENMRPNPEELSKRGVSFYEVERGGDLTYHGPGQITAYPVFDLARIKKDIHLFLRRLEDAVIGFLSESGVKAIRRNGLTGVWIAQKKIASIGIAVKNWISFHGLSVNIKKDDLDNFGLIRPCGMDIEMVSLENALGREIDMEQAKQRLINKFKEEKW